MEKSALQNLLSGSWKVLGVLTGLAFFMRFFSFFPSVIDHDESTYILIADAIRHGQIYLRDVVDTKPIGIFTLFALFQTLFGKTIIGIRLLTTAWIAMTAWMVYLVHRQLLKPSEQADYNPAPIASGIIYIFITSIYTYYGVSPNTELFFNLFTITALFFILRCHQPGWFFLSGLLLGLGFMIKYVVLFDAIALGLFYLWSQVIEKKKWSYWFSRCVVMAMGFMVPFLIVWMYYRQIGLEDTFLFFTFELSGRYFAEPTEAAYFIYLGEVFLRFLPVTVWFFFCIWYWRVTGPSLSLLGGMWGGMVMLIILLPGKLFGHYFIQFMLPFSLVAGSFFDLRRNPSSALAWMRKPQIGYSLLAIILVVNLIFQKIDYYDKKDYPREVAAYLNKMLQPGDILYTGDFHPITYLLTGTQSPTPYIHRSLLLEAKNNEALKINRNDEIQKIFQQMPRFVLIKNKLEVENPLYPALTESYLQVKDFDGKVRVYEKRK